VTFLPGRAQRESSSVPIRPPTPKNVSIVPNAKALLLVLASYIG